MKYLIPLIIATFLLISCNLSPESKSQASIKKYMNENINDLKSYEPIKFGQIGIDSTYSTDEPEYKVYEDSVEIIKNKLDEIVAEHRHHEISSQEFLRLGNIYTNYSLDLINKELAFMKQYKSRPCGFSMLHVFRKKNSTGAIVIDSMYFRLDSNYNVKPKSFYYLINK